MQPFDNNIFRFLVLFCLTTFVGNSQIIKVKIVGGSEVINASTITIDAGASLDFRITNTDTSNCSNRKRLDIDSVELAVVTGTFDISPNNRSKNIRQSSCNGRGNKRLNFIVTNTNATCSPAETNVIIESELGTFTFTLIVNSSPVISVLGGSPSADILDGSTTTTATNGTYFGIIEAGATVTRYFIITNTGSCSLDITGITASVGWFFVPTTPAPYVILPDFATPDFLPANIDPGSFVVLPITFVAPAGTGLQTSTINISNNDNTTFTFDVSANLFDFNIPGPGGITADFRLWLKSTRGVTRDGSNKVSNWADIGTNGKPASQAVSANQPTYMDDASSNINFNPVIKFENDGTVSQYLENVTNGFYSQDIFIVMQPDDDVTTSS